MQINFHKMTNNTWKKSEIRIVPQTVTVWELEIGNRLERKKCCLKDFLIDKTLFELYFENHLTKQTYKNNADAKNNFLPLVNFKHIARCVTWIFNRAVSNSKKLEWKIHPVKKTSILPCLPFRIQNTLLIEILSIEKNVIFEFYMYFLNLFHLYG